MSIRSFFFKLHTQIFMLDEKKQLRLIIFVGYIFYVNLPQGLHRLEKYLNIQDCLGKSLKIKFTLKNT